MRAWNSTLRAGGPLRTYKPMKSSPWKKRAPKELKFSLWDAAYARWAPVRDGEPA